MKGIIQTVTATILAVFTLATAAFAAGDAILTIEHVSSTGDVTQSRSYSLEDLQAMQVATFKTETIWTEGMQSFTGVTLSSIVSELGLSEGEIEAVAINSYAVQIPVSDAVANGPIIAFERNGDTMSIRDKGPLWVVYPYDSDPAFRTEAVYSRSIWQLEKLVIKQ